MNGNNTFTAFFGTCQPIDKAVLLLQKYAKCIYLGFKFTLLPLCGFAAKKQIPISMKKFDRAVQLVEAIGAIAVVLSLIYVGFEIRQNTRAIQDTSHQNSLTIGHQLEDKLWDPEFSITYNAGLQDYSTLSGPQKRQFDSFVSQNFNVWEYTYYARERQTMEEDIWNGWDRWFRSQAALEPWKQVWRQKRGGYGDSFQAYADSVVDGE